MLKSCLNDFITSAIWWLSLLTILTSHRGKIKLETSRMQLWCFLISQRLVPPLLPRLPKQVVHVQSLSKWILTGLHAIQLCSFGPWPPSVTTCLLVTLPASELLCSCTQHPSRPRSDPGLPSAAIKCSWQLERAAWFLWRNRGTKGHHNPPRIRCWKADGSGLTGTVSPMTFSTGSPQGSGHFGYGNRRMPLFPGSHPQGI